MNKSIIGTRIRYERQKAGLTLEELGNKVGVSKQCLSGWEHGRNMADVVSLYMMAKFFHLKIEDFLFEASEDKPINHANKVHETNDSEYQSSFSLSPKEKQLINKFRALNTDRRKAVEILFGIRTSRLT